MCAELTTGAAVTSCRAEGRRQGVVCHWATPLPSGDLIKTHINKAGGTSQLPRDPVLG